MYLTRIAGIETGGGCLKSGGEVMYLTRIAGIETEGGTYPYFDTEDVSYPHSGN